MSYKKFNNNDVFKNTIKTNPQFEFKIYRGKTYLNNSLDGFVRLKNDIVNPSPEAACNLPYSFDLNCEDNTQNIALI